MKFVCPRRSGDYKNRLEEMKSTRRECTPIMERRQQQNREERHTESSVSMQGRRLYRQASKKGYNQTQEQAE